MFEFTVEPPDSGVRLNLNHQRSESNKKSEFVLDFVECNLDTKNDSKVFSTWLKTQMIRIQAIYENKRKQLDRQEQFSKLNALYKKSLLENTTEKSVENVK